MRKGLRSAAAWRSDPPIDDELWARVQLVRERRIRGGGGAHAVHQHLLSKLLWCVCGSRVRANGARGYRHQRPCEQSPQLTYRSATFEAPIRAQIAATHLSKSQVANIARLAGQPVEPPTGELRKRQLERELAGRANAHAKREITTEQYLADHARITADIDAITARPPAAPLADVDEIVAMVNNIRLMWQEGDESVRGRVARAIYDRVVVRAGEVVHVELTPDAWRHGLAFALPEKVALARPAGLEPATF